jgi:hypothetical protein
MYDRYRQATILLIYMALTAASTLPLMARGDEAQSKAASPPAERPATGTENRSTQVVVGDSVASVQQNNVTRLTIPGSLAATLNLGCVTLAAIDKSAQPPDLYKAIPQCITAGRYPEAVELFMLAGLEVRFDATRVTDKTAGQAGQVMIMNTFNPLPQEQRQKFADAFNVLIKEPKTLTQVCEDAQRLGPPTYYPEYMILHGIKAFTGDPRVSAVDTAMNGQAVWSRIQHTYLNCPTSL